MPAPLFRLELQQDVADEQTGRRVLPKGTFVFEVDGAGNVWFGPNRLVGSRDGGSRVEDVIDGLIALDTLRAYFRTFVASELGDLPEFILRRAGNDNYPDGDWPNDDRSSWPIKKGTPLGGLRGMGWHAYPGRPGGCGFQAFSGDIYFRAAEDLKQEPLPGGGYKTSSGGSIHLAPTPVGKSQPEDAVVLEPDKTARFLGNLRLRDVGAATPSGGRNGDVVKGDGCLWVNDLGTWRSLPFSP